MPAKGRPSSWAGWRSPRRRRSPPPERRLSPRRSIAPGTARRPAGTNPFPPIYVSLGSSLWRGMRKVYHKAVARAIARKKGAPARCRPPGRGLWVRRLSKNQRARRKIGRPNYSRRIPITTGEDDTVGQEVVSTAERFAPASEESAPTWRRPGPWGGEVAPDSEVSASRGGGSAPCWESPAPRGGKSGDWGEPPRDRGGTPPGRGGDTANSERNAHEPGRIVANSGRTVRRSGRIAHALQCKEQDFGDATAVL